MKNNLADRLARIVSDLFIPPFFTLTSFLFLTLWLEADAGRVMLFNIISFLFGVVFPIAMFLVMRKKGRVADNDARKKEERTIPFIYGALIYLGGFLSLYIAGAEKFELVYWFCYVTNTLLLIPINKYWKISVHAMGASGPGGMLFLLFGPASLIYFIIVILVGWSRIRLKCHTPAQVAAGALYGFFSILLHLILLT